MAISELRHDVKIIDRPPGVRLYRGSAMLAAAVVLALVFNAANLPSPLYVIYKDRFGFSEITLTLVFAVYVVGSVVAMTVFGRLSDFVGRRPVLFAAIALSAVSAVIFLVTFNTATLFAARIVSGLAIGLVATACTAWIAELQPEGDKGAAARVATGANLAGLGLGPLVAGLLAELAPLPLKLPFLVYLVGLVPPAVVVWTVHETVRRKRPLSEVPLKPQVSVPHRIAGQFIAPAVTAFASFALMGFYSSLIPSLLADSLQIDNHAASGAVIFFMFGCGILAIALSGALSSRAMMFSGLVLVIPGVVMLVLAQHLESLVLLLAASVIGGMSGALGYCGSLQVINEIAPGGRRAETVSAYMLACYIGVSVPVIGIGVVTELVSAGTADVAFAALLCVLALTAIAVGRRLGGNSR
jgi:MFS family permease